MNDKKSSKTSDKPSLDAHKGSSDEAAAHDHLDAYIVKDPHQMAINLAKMVEKAGQAATAWLEPREKGVQEYTNTEPVADMVTTLSKVSEYWLSDPKRALDAQTQLFSSFMGVWQNSINKMHSETAENAKVPVKDKRFQDEDWQDNAFFDFLRSTYEVTSDWADKMVDDAAEALDPTTEQKARFYTKQISAALSPANFLLTNPELYKETIASNGENLARGATMLAEDMIAGHGDLKIRQASRGSFKIGEDIAPTKGAVIARSDVAEIIQYEPRQKNVLARPLLICPPWINKFYILDLNEKKSFIKWCLDQGHQVFVISWVNPDERHKDKDWGDYIKEGIEFGLDAVEKETGAQSVNAIGYCVGGTLLAAALALFAKTGETRIASATLFTTQVDFTYAGDLKVFVDEAQIAAVERQMNIKGYLDGAKMATAFNMLRSADLIWPYAVNAYMKGANPPPFDLLFWNADSTRMGAANHSFYLRNCYLKNLLSQGKMVIHGETISLSDIKIPIYNLAAKEDHIAPAKSVHFGSSLFGGPVDLVLSGSGHIAGVINPPDKMKYQYWTAPLAPEEASESYEEWFARTTETKGSWWGHWHKWTLNLNNKTKAAESLAKNHTKLADAPGTYVLEVT